MTVISSTKSPEDLTLTIGQADAILLDAILTERV